LLLAALSVQVEYGDHNPDRHKAGFLSSILQDYIPLHLYRLQKPKVWERDLIATVSSTDFPVHINIRHAHHDSWLCACAWTQHQKMVGFVSLPVYDFRCRY
jgi:hypothetical protein